MLLSSVVTVEENPLLLSLPNSKEFSWTNSAAAAVGDDDDDDFGAMVVAAVEVDVAVAVVDGVVVVVAVGPIPAGFVAAEKLGHPDDQPVVAILNPVTEGVSCL